MLGNPNPVFFSGKWLCAQALELDGYIFLILSEILIGCVILISLFQL